MEEIQLVVHKDQFWSQPSSVNTELSKETSYQDRIKALNNLIPALFGDFNYFMTTQEVNSDLDFIRILLEKKASIETISFRGEEIYDIFKENLEKNYNNQFVAIDIVNKTILSISSDPVILAKDIKKYPDKKFYTRRIGKLSLLT